MQSRPPRPGGYVPGPVPPALCLCLGLVPTFTELGLDLYAHTDMDIKGGDLGGLSLRLQTSAPLHACGLLRLDLRLEAGVGGFCNYASRLEFTMAPGLRLYLPPPGPWAFIPFAEAGLDDHNHGLTSHQTRWRWTWHGFII